MTKNQIIAHVQAGNNIHPEENIFVPITPEQYKAMGLVHKAIAKANMFKLGERARMV